MKIRITLVKDNLFMKVSVKVPCNNVLDLSVILDLENIADKSSEELNDINELTNVYMIFFCLFLS